MKPTVVVASQGELTTKEIIKGILEEKGGDTDKLEKVQSYTGEEYTIHLCDIKTKYYENRIALLPVEAKDIVNLPEDILKVTEMLIIYVNPKNKSFLEQVPVLKKFLEDNDIELGILLTTKLYDNANDGLTYEELKSQAKFQFDIIELHDTADEEPENYTEVLEALKNHVWSNITKPMSGCSLDDDENFEEELENFEELLTSIQNFKNVSRNMERSDVIDEAERLAELFVKMLQQD